MTDQVSQEIAIIGVGLAGANVTSLERLFVHAPADLGAAWVVLCQPEDAVDPTRLAQSLGEASRLAASVAQDGTTLAADHIYVCPLDRTLILQDGTFRAPPGEQPPGERATIDSFIISLAKAHKEYAIGIRLAFPGADGTAGETALKRYGGLVLCEREAVAAGGLHPLIDPSGLADFVLPTEDMPAKIKAYLNYLRRTTRNSPFERLLEESAESLIQVAGILRNKTGHDFHGYKPNTFMRRIQRRMQVVQAENIVSYVDCLRRDADEVGHLFQDLLIGVTSFFRDKPEFELLEREVAPALFAGKTAADQIRVWVLGCATGEEAYSIAMILRERMATLDEVPRVQIFATDIDGKALTMARSGRYPETIARDVSPDRLARWFDHQGTTFQIAKELREMCIFSQHSVVKDAPFSRFDVISCRNLLIYLMPELQERIIPLFHFALKPGGYLFLGPSENVTRHTKLFGPIDRKHRIFRRLESDTRVLPDFPLTTRAALVAPAAETEKLPSRKTGQTLVSRAGVLVERYAPAFIVLDKEQAVVHFSGRTGQFLEPATGAATLNIVSLVNGDLRAALRRALASCAAAQKPVRADGIQVGEGANARTVDLAVEPIPGAAAVAGFVVLFRDMGPATRRQEPEPDGYRNETVERLETELRLLRERLQATIEELESANEELESANEELKSSNEEYQSINEELQSANEELETSKEELQSVNEELQTVNGELSHRISDLAKANSDVKNLLESTEIATIFLDNDLRVKNFTPAVAEIFHLIETDLDRPLAHIASRISYLELQDDVRRVLRTLSTIEREVGSGTQERYLVRLLPYRSVDNFIAGVVITFLNVTATVRAEEASAVANQRMSEIVESIADAFYALDPELRFTFANRRALETWGKGANDVIGRPLAEVVPSLVDSVPFKAQKQALADRQPHYLEAELLETARWYAISIYPSVGGISVFLRDIHDQKLAADALRTAEESLNVALAAAEMGTWDVDLVTGETRRAPDGQAIFDFSGKPGWSIDDIQNHLVVDDREAFRQAYEQAMVTGSLKIEGRVLRDGQSDRPRWIRVEGRTSFQDGRPTRIAGIMQDVTDRKWAEGRLILLMSELQHRVKNILAVVRSIAARTVRKSDTLEQFAAHFDGRLNALARTQSFSARHGAEGLELEEIVREELLAQAPHDDQQASISGPVVRLKGKAAEIFALALHELATNSVKYGALGASNGKVSVHWRVMEMSNGRRLSLDWQESGVPLLDPQPKRVGFGRELLERGLPYDLGAVTSLEFAPGGTRFRIEVDTGDLLLPAGLASAGGSDDDGPDGMMDLEEDNVAMPAP